MAQGWNKRKVDAFKTAFYDFLTHVRIVSKEKLPEDGEIATPILPLYRSQQMILDEIFDGLANDIHNFVVLKARQLGCSTLVRVLLVFWAAVHPGLRLALIYDTEANKEDARLEVQSFISNLPSTHHIKVTDDNRYAMQFSNGSRISFFVAGVSKRRSTGALGRSRGINCVGATEVCSWADIEGLKALERSLAEHYPNRLYLWESTARGFNMFYDIWEAAKADDITRRAIFIGWWAKEIYSYAKGTPLFERYGKDPPTEEEKAKIIDVYRRYNYKITQEQLAWYRHQSNPSNEVEGEYVLSEGGDIVRQELPWCVVAGTRVGTSIGIVPIVEVFSGLQTTHGEITSAGKTGRAEVVTVTTSKGYSFTGTKNHPVALADGTFIDASESAGRSVVLSPPRMADDLYTVRWADGPIRSEVTITAGLARLIGYYMGDGSIYGSPRSGYCLSIACDRKDRDVVSDVLGLLRDELGVEAQTRIGGSKGGMEEVRVSSKAIYDLFKRLGLMRTDTGKTMRRVHVPEFIWRSPRHVIREFLRGLFEADGFNGYGCPRVVLFSNYQPFLADVQHLVLAFGVTCNLRRVEKKNSDHTYVGNELVFRASEAMAFNEAIGFCSSRKSDRCTSWPTSPMAIAKRRPMVLVDEVVSVAPAGVADVYNVSVGDAHVFDAGGILTHNTEEDAFIQSGASYFSADTITEYTKKAINLKYKGYRFGFGESFINTSITSVTMDRHVQLRVWDEPDPAGVYIVACDPAYGHREDSNCSAIEVLRCYADGVDQVAEFKAPGILPHQFAWVIATVCGWYGNVRMIVELNGPGEAVWNEFRHLREMLAAGYIYEQAQEKGLSNILGNIKNYMYARSDSMSGPTALQWKGLSLTEVVPTPNGWSSVGDLSVGDSLFDETGGLCSIIGLSEVWTDHDCYRMSFDNGTSIIVDAEHLWPVAEKVRKVRMSYRGSLVRTDQIIPGEHFIPVAASLDGPDVDLPVDPYALGVWLGDGEAVSGRFFSHADDIEEISGYISDAGFSLSGEGRDRRNPNAIRRSIYGLRHFLGLMGLLGNKHIPAAYLRASRAQRERLLQGMMDTDGNVHHDTRGLGNHQCCFTSSNPPIAAGFRELLLTFGIKPRSVIRHRGGGSQPAEQFYFWAPRGVNPFRLKRKAERVVRPDHAPCSRTTFHKIVAVEKIDRVPVKCLAVDSHSHLFLAGRGMVPTHNTTNDLKRSALERFRDIFQMRIISLRSMPLLNEMKGIIREGDEIHAEGNKDDDLVIAMAIGLRTWEDFERKAMNVQRRTRAFEHRKQTFTFDEMRQMFSQNLLEDFFNRQQNDRRASQRRARRWR